MDSNLIKNFRRNAKFVYSFRFRVLGLLEEEKMHQFNEISIGSLVIINEHA